MSSKNSGFTLIELILVIGLFSVLVMIATVNLTKPQVTASVSSSASVLIADLRQQQLKAMLGNTQGSGIREEYGIHFETRSYTLFKGITYSPTDPDNFVIELDEGISLTNIEFPSTQVVFSRLSGEISGFSEGANSVSVTHTQSGESEIIVLNKFGVNINE